MRLHYSYPDITLHFDLTFDSNCDSPNCRKRKNDELSDVGQVMEKIDLF